MQLNLLQEWTRAQFPILSSLALKPNSEGQEISPSSTYQSTHNSISAEAETQIAATKNQLNSELSHPAPEILEKLSQLNQKRSTQGLAAIDFAKTTQRIAEIYQDSSLSDKAKKQKIDGIRKELGLSKGDMKKLFTKRLQTAYQAAEKRLATFEKAKSEQMKNELKQTESIFGKDSPQAMAIQEKMETLKEKLQPERESLKSQAKFFGSVYPSFWSKLGNAFKKIGGAFSKVLSVFRKIVRFIPALGPLLSSAMHSVQSLLQGKFKQLGKSLLGVLSSAKSFLPLIPGIGTIASYAVTGIQALVKAGRP